jgi:hemoglobin
LLKLHNLRNAFLVAITLAVFASPGAFAQQTAPTSAGDDAIPADDSVPADTDTPDADEAKPVRAPGTMDPAPADPALKPVFDEFGGVAGLTALMDDFMVRLLADARIKSFFENADQKRIKAHLVEQFCVILGGPCSYSGRDMKTTHADLGIDRAKFNALVEDLQVAMDARHIPFRAQNKLLAVLAPMHREIETK